MYIIPQQLSAALSKIEFNKKKKKQGNETTTFNMYFILRR